MNFLKLFAVSPDTTPIQDASRMKSVYNRMRWSVFLSATLGYGLYYVCRLSLNVIKKPIVDAGVLTETELGIMGSAMFITYAVGKFANSFLADRSNIRIMLAFGMLISALINLLLGNVTSFFFFVTLWAINGWVQSMGAGPCVVALSRWFTEKERGTFYGMWASSHNIGEALTYVLTALIVSTMGWQWGFKGAGFIGLIGFVIIIIFMRDTPGSCGLPSVNEFKGEKLAARVSPAVDKKAVAAAQREVLRNPAVWILALSSAFMYISRYAVNSWGIFYLEAEKGYTMLEASSVISIGSICGIIGTATCGYISDRFFKGRRNVPALVYGLMNVVSLVLFLFGPRHVFWVDALSMVLFGLAIGALITYLGGLMATDIASKKASGAALGVVGVASYAGAALQDMVSGLTIERSKTVIDGVTTYDFSFVSWFWVGAAVLSVICAAAVWNVKPRED